MMSNRADFVLAEGNSLAVPAGRCVVFVDGVLCCYLAVKQVVRAAGPEYGWARLEYEPAIWAEGERIAVESIERIAGMGRRVRIACMYDGGTGATEVEAVTLFAGRIERIETEIGSQGERAEIVAKDYAARLGRVTVFGQRVMGRDGRTGRIDGRDLVFNRGRLPDASNETVQHGGRRYRVFECGRVGGRLWTCAETVRYLLSEHLVAGGICRTCRERTFIACRVCGGSGR